MPELPEVETIRRGLEKELKGRSLKEIVSISEKLFLGDKNIVINQKVKDIQRRAKILLINFEKSHLIVHLKMTGQLIFIPDKKPNDITIGGHPDRSYSLSLPHKHTHVILRFDHGVLYYNDLRKFGWLRACSTDSEVNDLISHLGPEFDSENFTLEYLVKQITKRKITIKQLLLDQTIIAGLGNIYADETLFCAKINPSRLASSLSQKEIEKIYRCIPVTLLTALKHGGTTLKDFRHVNGGYGSYLDFANVYGRAKQKCKICSNLIQSIKLGSRTASYCSNCQK